MPHSVSDQAPVRVLGRHFLAYSPLRRYYYFRNTVYFLRQPYSRGPWRRRLLAGILLRLTVNFVIDPQRVRGLRMSLTGIAHGLRGRLGQYPS